MLRLILLFFSVFILYVPTSISGAVYKCVDNEDRVTFQSVECKESSKEEVVIKKPITADSEIVKIKTAIKIDDEVQSKCIRLYDDVLKDPRSAYIVSADTYHMINTNKKIEWDIVVLDTRSKNAMGGYGILALTCQLNSDLRVDEEGTKSYKAMLTLGITP